MHVPAGWHGRLRTGSGGFFTLTLASFPLIAEADDVDEQAARRMARGDVLLLVLGYGRGQVGRSAFGKHVRMPLTVQRMRFYHQFEHLPHGHQLARILLVAAGRAYEVQVQFAGPLTPALRVRANGVLRLLRFSKSLQRTAAEGRRCQEKPA